jgi:hypothetical protein
MDNKKKQERCYSPVNGYQGQPELNYIRVGTEYYRIGHKLTSKGKLVPALYVWKRSIIIEDYGRPLLNKIKKYIAFTNVPDNESTYQREHTRNEDTFYNLYEPLKYFSQPGCIDYTLAFIKHIFQRHFELALDYLKILYENPTQKLPVICLVSKIQGTGKTTFLQWVSEIYGTNSITLGNEDFNGKFNSHWAGKLIICVDESFIDKRLVKEKIKRLATDDCINMEAKGKDYIKLDFNGKFILTSNNEDNFIQMDAEDNRFFVLKAPEIPNDQKDPDLLEKLKAEIPAFLYFLKQRQFVFKKSSRLWFDSKEYETDALRKVRYTTRNKTEKEMINWCDRIFCIDKDINEITTIPIKMSEQLRDSLRHINGLSSDIERIFKEEWNLTPSNNAKFKFPRIVSRIIKEDNIEEEVVEYTRHTGKYYTIRREFIDSKSKI